MALIAFVVLHQLFYDFKIGKQDKIKRRGIIAININTYKRIEHILNQHRFEH